MPPAATKGIPSKLTSSCSQPLINNTRDMTAFSQRFPSTQPITEGLIPVPDRSSIIHSASSCQSRPHRPAALHCVVTDPVTAGPSPHQRPSLPKDARPIKKPKRHNDTKANREVRSPSTRTPNDSIREAERCIHKLQTGFGQLAPQMLATTSGLNQLKDPWPA
ncbi:hypothetical protein EB796_007725 [Bugula neritina]|uniref:Uncharacterized protein n=1 Tax=Bugula neritina TaxID=10212 RepID=A0A7J7K6Z8_BUGNE|nr:hypothetical protein EB796_007725 [Bugula neritina]